MFMPKRYCRIRLRLEQVRWQRLNDITEDDAIAEGIGHGFQMNSGWPDYQHIKENNVCTRTQDCARMSFATLWDSINDRDWESNPWVLVYTFRRL